MQGKKNGIEKYGESKEKDMRVGGENKRKKGPRES